MDFCSVRGRDLSTFTAQCVCMGRDPRQKKKGDDDDKPEYWHGTVRKNERKVCEANHDVVVVDSLTLFFLSFFLSLSLSIAEVDVFSTPTITFCLFVRKW